MSDSALVHYEVAMFSHHLEALPESPRVISRCREDAHECLLIATSNVAKKTGGNVKYLNHNAEVCNETPQKAKAAADADKTSAFGSSGVFRIDLGQYDETLGRWRADRSEGARRDNDAGIRTGLAYSDPRASSAAGRASHLIYAAEGARARAAGLLEDENPYLWPPGAGLAWREGWHGVSEITDGVK